MKDSQCTSTGTTAGATGQVTLDSLLELTQGIEPLQMHVLFTTHTGMNLLKENAPHIPPDPREDNFLSWRGEKYLFFGGIPVQAYPTESIARAKAELFRQDDGGSPLFLFEHLGKWTFEKEIQDE